MKISIFLLMITSFWANAFSGTDSLMECSALYEKNGVEEGYVIIDFREPEEYNTGHIPNAINIWRNEIVNEKISYGGMMATKEAIEALFSELGITNGDELIIYDAKGLCDAARLWWILNHYGYTKVKLLNGGMQQWKKLNYPLSTEKPTLSESEFKFDESLANKSYFASIDDVNEAISNPEILLVDVREFEEFTGEFMKKGAYRSGRIPSSLWSNWNEVVNYKNQTKLWDIAKLKKIFLEKGITPDKRIIAYCQSGVRSAHTTFVLTQILGYPNVKNYDGSWIEWSYHKNSPIEQGSISQKSTNAELVLAKKKNYGALFIKAYENFPKYVWAEMTFKVSSWYKNYFWLLVVLSLVVWLLEIVFPWRKDQPILRKDFFLDAFYMFFNFYLFKIIIFFAFSVVVENWFADLIGGLDKLVIYDTSQLHPLVQLIVFFVLLDFIQWFTHVLLHRYDFLWQFHKVHHSVEQMGFAAHFRFHWMENVFYTPMKFIMMMIIGNFSPENAFVVYYITIAIGHLNHANIGLSYGPLKYIINNPKMHIWHHAHHLPESRKHGVNFGISLSLWDYIFKTNYIPKDGRDIKIGFEGIKVFPKGFFKQLFYGFYR